MIEIKCDKCKEKRQKIYIIEIHETTQETPWDRKFVASKALCEKCYK